MVEVSCSKHHEFHLGCIFQSWSQQLSNRHLDELRCTVCDEHVMPLFRFRNGEDLALEVSQENDGAVFNREQLGDYTRTTSSPYSFNREQLISLNIENGCFSASMPKLMGKSPTYTYDSGNVLTTPASNGRSEGTEAQAGAVFNREQLGDYTRRTSSPYSFNREQLKQLSSSRPKLMGKSPQKQDLSSLNIENGYFSVPINLEFCKKIYRVNLDLKVNGDAEFDIDKVKKELVVRLPLFFEAKTVNVKSSGMLEVREPFSEMQKGVFDSFKLAYNGKSSISIAGSEFSLDFLHPYIIWYLTKNAKYYTKLLLPQIKET